jgi:hypothetical protein
MIEVKLMCKFLLTKPEIIIRIGKQYGYNCKFLNKNTLYIESENKVYEYYCEICEDYLSLKHKNNAWNRKYHVQGKYYGFHTMFQYLQEHDIWKLKPHKPEGVARAFYRLEHGLIPKFQMM